MGIGTQHRPHGRKVAHMTPEGGERPAQGTVGWTGPVYKQENKRLHSERERETGVLTSVFTSQSISQLLEGPHCVKRVKGPVSNWRSTGVVPRRLERAGWTYPL